MLAPSHFGVIPELRQPLRGSVGKVVGTCLSPSALYLGIAATGGGAS
jgi:hypothetical protein